MSTTTSVSLAGVNPTRLSDTCPGCSSTTAIDFINWLLAEVPALCRKMRESAMLRRPDGPDSAPEVSS
jgi:hypothetical protein